MISSSMNSSKVFARLDQRHRHVERRKDRRIFQPDHPGADHSQAARHARVLDEVVAVEHIGAVERDVRGPIGMGADGDQHLVRLDLLLDLAPIFAAHHGDAVRIEEAPHADHALHAVAGELVFQHGNLVIQRLAEPGGKIGGADVLLDPV